MQITLHLKNQPEAIEYNMAVAEIRKLVSDFEQYQRVGKPTMGIYICQTDERGVTKKVFIDFETIAQIS